ncbi:MAG: right-handed parallel beta-helix repeat-containing protein [Prosthecobacter sp.]|uniref:right-handed parallel beta-helix repeat-containing protein n=1 Tax=Prosthecobacter sp. TaxID=1965333 RepID=UPI0038FDE9DE
MKILFLLCFWITAVSFAQPVTTVAELLESVSRAAQGTVIDIGEGTFRLSQPLDLKSGTTLKGAGIGKTIVTHTPEWKAATDSLPDPETNHQKFDRSGYLIRFADKATAITLSDMTLTGPQLHGAIFGFGNTELKLHHLRIEDFLYAGIRTYAMSHAKIHDCTFVDSGQRWERGQPGVKGGITGGGIFVIWLSDSEIWNNRFLRTKTAPNEHYYGIKGRQGKRCHIHHNTIETNFSIEFPFENDQDVEIDHNICHGTISIPKHAGGPVPASGKTFHIHHNLFRDSYSIEFVRNGVEIDHNLFDFDPAQDHGNTISGFGKAAASGPAQFHNNLVSNPGRGVIWINEPFNRLEVRNNHIIARTTATPRTEGLLGFNADCDFKTFVFKDNIIECLGTARPLFRNDASAAALVENNRLTNVTDTARYMNQQSGALVGLEGPLAFRCGVDGEVVVEGWKSQPAAK